MSRRSEDFRFQQIVQKRIVVPKFYQKVWPDCEILEIDSMHNSLSKLLDIQAGIDKVIKMPDGCLRGLAQRIQRKCFGDFNTLTIRVSRIYRHPEGDLVSFNTEFRKMQRAIETKAISATVQCHCYADADDEEMVTDLITGIIVDRLGLYEWILREQKKDPKFLENHTKPTTNEEGEGRKQEFYFFAFNKIPNECIIARYGREETRHSKRIKKEENKRMKKQIEENQFKFLFSQL